MHHLEMSSDC